VSRKSERYAVVDAARLLNMLMEVRPARAVVVAEGGGWAALLPGLPVHGDGDTSLEKYTAAARKALFEEALEVEVVIE